MIDKFLIELGLTKIMKERCVYVDHNGEMIVFVHVDDIGVMGKRNVLKCLNRNQFPN
jgi:hypothetical protein